MVDTAEIVSPLQPIQNFSAETLLDNFTVNAVAPAILTCGLSGEMVDGARVMNFSSRAALLILPRLSAHRMSKHALRSITRSLQLELPEHIAVSSLIPGEVGAGMQGALLLPDAEVFPLVSFFKNNVGRLIPAGIAANFIYWILLILIQQISLGMMTGISRTQVIIKTGLIRVIRSMIPKPEDLI